MGKTSTASKQRYNVKAYDRVEITVKKGYKSTIQEHCAITGESVNEFIKRAIFETIERDEMTPGFLHGVGSDTSDKT